MSTFYTFFLAQVSITQEFHSPPAFLIVFYLFFEVYHVCHDNSMSYLKIYNGKKTFFKCTEKGLIKMHFFRNHSDKTIANLFLKDIIENNNKYEAR
jgi:hypothetical protein